MDVTFLTGEQIWGDAKGQGQLQVIKDYGRKTGLSDLAVLQGGVMGRNSKTSDGQLSGDVWSASSVAGRAVWAVNCDGDRLGNFTYEGYCGARPVLPSGLSKAKPTKTISGVEVVEYGEYPQTIADEATTRELEQAFSEQQLQKTGKTYTFNKTNIDQINTAFFPEDYVEYQHNGKRYIRVEAHPFGKNYILSNGDRAEKSKHYWIEVQPIEWLRDPSGICVARQALFAGVLFDRKRKYDGNFEETDMKRFLLEHFARDMQVAPQKETEIGSQESNKTAKTWEERFKPGDSGRPQGLG